MHRPNVRISRRGLVTLAVAGIVAPIVLLALVGFGLVDRLFHFQNEILQDYSRFSVQYAAAEIERQVQAQERDIVSYLQLVCYEEPFVPEFELRRAELEYPLIEHAFLLRPGGDLTFGKRARVPSDSCVAALLTEETARAERIIRDTLTGGTIEHILLSGDMHFYVGAEAGEPYQLVAAPARDSNFAPRGLIGFFVSESTVRREVVSHILDTTIHTAEGRFSPDFGHVLTFVVDDDAGRAVYTHRHTGENDNPPQGRRFLAQAPLDGLFPGWHVRITYTKPSGFAWSKRVLMLQVALLSVAAVLAVLGTLFVIRFSLRQMELSRLKMHFVSNITHELKTPLAAIRLYTETLQQGRVRDPGEANRFLEIIHKETVRLTALINNILDFSQLEGGRRRYTFTLGSVGDVVRDVLESYGYQLRAKGFELTSDIVPDLPALRIDRDALGQAVLNLIDNAAKYSGDDKRVHVTVGREDHAVVVRIQDHGVGIPARELSKIFRAFYRVEKGLQHDVKGSGLGLAVVKHVAEAHGGKVTVESKPGEGSTFALHLPAEVEAATTVDAATAADGAAARDAAVDASSAGAAGLPTRFGETWRHKSA